MQLQYLRLMSYIVLLKCGITSDMHRFLRTLQPILPKGILPTSPRLRRDIIITKQLEFKIMRHIGNTFSSGCPFYFSVNVIMTNMALASCLKEGEDHIDSDPVSIVYVLHCDWLARYIILNDWSEKSCSTGTVWPMNISGIEPCAQLSCIRPCQLTENRQMHPTEIFKRASQPALVPSRCSN